MSIKFSTLWLIWLGGVFYNLICINWGFFPEHTPVQRLSEIFDTAWFIAGAWFIVRWVLRPRVGDAPKP